MQTGAGGEPKRRRAEALRIAEQDFTPAAVLGRSRPRPVGVLPRAQTTGRRVCCRVGSDQRESGPGHVLDGSDFVRHDDRAHAVGASMDLVDRRRLTCDRSTHGAILGTDGAIMKFGRSRKFASPLQKLALALQDRLVLHQNGPSTIPTTNLNDDHPNWLPLPDEPSSTHSHDAARHPFPGN